MALGKNGQAHVYPQSYFLLLPMEALLGSLTLSLILFILVMEVLSKTIDID